MDPRYTGLTHKVINIIDLELHKNRNGKNTIKSNKINTQLHKNNSRWIWVNLHERIVVFFLHFSKWSDLLTHSSYMFLSLKPFFQVLFKPINQKLQKLKLWFAKLVALTSPVSSDSCLNLRPKKVQFGKTTRFPPAHPTHSNLDTWQDAQPRQKSISCFHKAASPTA